MTRWRARASRACCPDSRRPPASTPGTANAVPPSGRRARVGFARRLGGARRPGVQRPAKQVASGLRDPRVARRCSRARASHGPGRSSSGHRAMDRELTRAPPAAHCCKETVGFVASSSQIQWGLMAFVSRVPRAALRRSSLRLPLSLPGSFASLTTITRTDS